MFCAAMVRTKEALMGCETDLTLSRIGLDDKRERTLGDRKRRLKFGSQFISNFISKFVDAISKHAGQFWVHFF